jgi:hypothetical protein
VSTSACGDQEDFFNPESDDICFSVSRVLLHRAGDIASSHFKVKKVLKWGEKEEWELHYSPYFFDKRLF